MELMSAISKSFEEVSPTRAVEPSGCSHSLMSSAEKRKEKGHAVLHILLGLGIGAGIGAGFYMLTGQLLYLTIAGVGCGLSLVFTTGDLSDRYNNH